MTSASNLGIPWANTHEPWIQGEKTLLQADFAQPVSEAFQNTSEGNKSSQYLQKETTTAYYFLCNIVIIH